MNRESELQGYGSCCSSVVYQPVTRCYTFLATLFVQRLELLEPIKNARRNEWTSLMRGDLFSNLT